MTMTEKKIKKIFAQLFGVAESKINDAVSYNSFRGWDSLMHLELINKLENEFNISIDIDDVLAMENFKKAKEIVKKYTAR